MSKMSSDKSINPNHEAVLTGTAPSRRNFMQSSLAVGAVATSSFLTRTVHAAGSDILKVGLVGCGGRGRGAAENAANADPGVRITALADMFPDRIALAKSVLQRNLRERFTVTDDTSFVGFDAYQKMLDSGIDVILLASPPHFRPDHLEASVKAGVHVFCEKPVATDPTGVRRVLAFVGDMTKASWQPCSKYSTALSVT
jgi:myo-inositol 2-dehydrogenase / D-chiro-inositol 1-dehydrogenase